MLQSGIVVFLTRRFPSLSSPPKYTISSAKRVKIALKSSQKLANLSQAIASTFLKPSITESAMARLGTSPSNSFSILRESFGKKGIDLLGIDRTLSNSTPDSIASLVRSNASTTDVSFHNCEVFIQYLLDSRESVSTFLTFSSASS